MCANITDGPEPGDGRKWIVKFADPGKEPIFYGTLIADAFAGDQEIGKLAMDAMRRYLPDGFEIIKIIAGSLILLEWTKP